ncbi:MAG: hypothetical protein AAGA18_10375 [Verrucomicrobiota bacterium]
MIMDVAVRILSEHKIHKKISVLKSSLKVPFMSGWVPGAAHTHAVPLVVGEMVKEFFTWNSLLQQVCNVVLRNALVHRHEMARINQLLFAR